MTMPTLFSLISWRLSRKQRLYILFLYQLEPITLRRCLPLLHLVDHSDHPVFSRRDQLDLLVFLSHLSRLHQAYVAQTYEFAKFIEEGRPYYGCKNHHHERYSPKVRFIRGNDLKRQGESNDTPYEASIPEELSFCPGQRERPACEFIYERKN